jgi:CRISPR-associated protein Cas1
MRTIQNTLYVMTPNSYLHLENDTVRVDVEHVKKLQVPLHHLGSLVCMGNIMISPALMHRCADDGISLVLLNEHGRFKARLEGAVSGNILLRRAQHQQADAPIFALEIARSFIAGKIKNSRYVLQRGARDANDDEDAKTLRAAAEHLAASLRAAAGAADLDALRGVEGEAAKTYFEAMPALVRRDVRPAFAMNGRSRRPPRDRFNALISFLYSMLMNDCRSALEAVGLDPQLGFLHAMRPGRAALALDLMEEFRAIAADRLALTLVNRGQVTEKDFREREGGAIQMEDDARRTVIVAYQERKQEEITHPLLDSKMPLGLVPMLQARLLARTVRGEMEGYLPFLAK